MYNIEFLVDVLYNLDDGFMTDLRRGRGINQQGLHKFFLELLDIEKSMSGEVYADREVFANLVGIPGYVALKSYDYSDPEQNWEIRELAEQINLALEFCFSSQPPKLSKFSGFKSIEVTPPGEFNPFELDYTLDD